MVFPLEAQLFWRLFSFLPAWELQCVSANFGLSTPQHLISGNSLHSLSLYTHNPILSQRLAGNLHANVWGVPVGTAASSGALTTDSCHFGSPLGSIRLFSSALAPILWSGNFPRQRGRAVNGIAIWVSFPQGSQSLKRVFKAQTRSLHIPPTKLYGSYGRKLPWRSLLHLGAWVKVKWYAPIDLDVFSPIALVKRIKSNLSS